MSNTIGSNGNSSNKRRKRGCVYELARLLVKKGQRVVCITGAGLSVASGVRPFRGEGGVWSSVVYDQGTRAAFRKHPLQWYNTFWIPHFVAQLPSSSSSSYSSTAIGVAVQPNAGHEALQDLMDILNTSTSPSSSSSSFTIITQNIDGLHLQTLYNRRQREDNATYTTTTDDDETTSNNANSSIIEAHGRLGLYKCIGEDDSDTDSDSDHDEHRLVHLGHRRKSRALRKSYYDSRHDHQDTSTSSSNENGGSNSIDTDNNGNKTKTLSLTCDSGNIDNENQSSSTYSTSSTTTAAATTTVRVPCRYELVDSIPLHDVHAPSSVRSVLSLGRRRNVCRTLTLTTPPCCPGCHRPCPPQALLFDEGYHSHDFYQFERCEDLLSNATVLMLVGTSLRSGVRMTQVALDHAKKCGVRVYNFNTVDMVPPMTTTTATTTMTDGDGGGEWMVHNIMGPAQETLPRLVEAVREVQASLGIIQPQRPPPRGKGDADVPKKRKKRAKTKPAVAAAKQKKKKSRTSRRTVSSASSSATNKTKKKKATMTKMHANEVWSGPPDDYLEGGWPRGWIKIKVQRTSGQYKGKLDPYWFSPITKKKLRSMVEVRRFMEALKVSDGDEEKAWAAKK